MRISGLYSSKVVVGLEALMWNRLRIVLSQDPKEIWDHQRICSQLQIKVECLVEVLLLILSSIIGITYMLIIVMEQDIKAMQKILL